MRSATSIRADAGADGAIAVAADRPVFADDLPAARAAARAAGKALLVEAWAPWCHTCLSMKHYVLPDPALAALHDRVVFATVDTDRPRNASFLERYVVEVWPTLFVIEPDSETVLGQWRGAASAVELRAFVNDALDARDAKAVPHSPVARLVHAKAAQARGDHASALRSFQQALRRGGRGWPRRSEALFGWLTSEYRLKRWSSCARLGATHAKTIRGAAVPTDFCWMLLGCAKELSDEQLKQQTHRAVLDRLLRHTAEPPADASVDDRADALNVLSAAYLAIGKPGLARRSTEARLELLEAAARAAPNAEAASTFDYARMTAYWELGRGQRAVAMLRERAAQLPDAYEPRARLAQSLMRLGRFAEALAAVDEAIERAYGPRQLRYLQLRADALAKLGRRDEHRAALVAVVAAFEALPAGQQKSERLRQQIASVRTKLAKTIER